MITVQALGPGNAEVGATITAADNIHDAYYAQDLTSDTTTRLTNSVRVMSTSPCATGSNISEFKALNLKREDVVALQREQATATLKCGSHANFYRLNDYKDKERNLQELVITTECRFADPVYRKLQQRLL